MPDTAKTPTRVIGFIAVSGKLRNMIYELILQDKKPIRRAIASIGNIETSMDLGSSVRTRPSTAKPADYSTAKIASTFPISNPMKQSPS